MKLLFRKACGPSARVRPKTDTRCGVARMTVVLLTAVLQATLLRTVLPQDSGESPETPPPPLVISVTPVDAATDETDPTQARAKTTFAAWEDLALAIRISNEGQQPLELLHTRYGEGFGDSAGKSNADWYSQFLYSLEFFRQDGSPVPYPSVIVVDAGMVLRGAEKVQLQPGQSLETLIRPAAWQPALRPRLDAGKYSVKVSCFGRTDEYADADQSRRITPGVPRDAPPAVTSEKVAFRLLSRPRQDLRWGPESNGLRAAMELVSVRGRGPCAFGEKYDVLFHVRNVSQDDVWFSSFLWLSDLRMSARHLEGGKADLSGTFYTGWTLTSRALLQPGAAITFNAGNVAFARDPSQRDAMEGITHRTLIADAGPCELQLRGAFGQAGGSLQDGEGNVLAPLPGDYVGELTTSPVLVNVMEPLAPADRAQSVLQYEVDCTFSRATLEDALHALCRQTQLELQLDGAALKTNGYTRNMIVSLDSGQTTLDDALRRILQRLPGLQYRIELAESGDVMVLVITDD